MKNVISHIGRLTTCAAVFTSVLMAADIELVGTIQDGLYAPTSIAVSSDGIAVLEPYSSQIKLYTADGQSTYKVDLNENAHALTSIGEYRYLFCDRFFKQVIQVDLRDGTRSPFISSSSDLIDPIDLIMTENQLHVLDAGRSAVVSFDKNGGKQSEVVLRDAQQHKLVFPSSFDLAQGLNRLYVLEQTSATVFVYSLDGTYITAFSSFGNESGQITRGGEIAVDGYNRVFVTDRFQGRVVSFDSEGNFLANIGGSNDLPLMATPTGLDVDEAGIIYVASTMSARIFLFYSTIYSASQLVQAGTVAPENDATLEADRIILTATAELSRPDITVSFFDFELSDVASGGLYFMVSYKGSPVINEITGTITSVWKVEEPLVEGNRYQWRTRAGWDGTLSEWSAWRTFSVAVNKLPMTFTLSQNYPNPFNPATLISFSLPETAPTRLEVFNLLGQQVTTLVDQTLKEGEYLETWDARDISGHRVATGVYFYRLSSGNYQQTRKMVVIQ